MKTKNTNSSNPYVKTMLMDIIKVLLFLVVFSTLFHKQLANVVDSISDFGYHHYFITTFSVLVVLAIVIENEVFHWDHITNLKNKLRKTDKKQITK